MCGSLAHDALRSSRRSILLAVFVLCIIERDRLADPSSDSYFNIWSIVLCARATVVRTDTRRETASAYSNQGFSLGVPDSNTSFSGTLRTLRSEATVKSIAERDSKLVLCVVMIRGRTRGLPLQIDRSIMYVWSIEPADVSGRQSSS